MRHQLLSLFILIITSLISITACSSLGGARSIEEQSAVKNEPIKVIVSIQPQKYFVERIGGELVDVNVMVPPGSDPHTFEPKPDQMRALSQAALYFSIGVEFEQAWMDKFISANPTMRIIDTTQGIERMPMQYEEHEAETADSATAPDPHIWLSPRLVKIQAETIYRALAEADATHQAEYQAGLESFLADIDRLDNDIRNALTGLKTNKFMVFHPAWGYFARDYDLEQVPIEVGGTEPSAAELARLITFARENNIKVIFASPEFNSKSAQVTAEEIKGQVLLISPLEEGWLDNMSRVAKAFAQAMQE